jgi:beta-glucosidase
MCPRAHGIEEFTVANTRAGSSDVDDYRDTGLEFPAPFLIGAATAAYQIEGAAHEDGRGVSIWDTFSHTPGRTLGGDTGEIADDHYHRMEADLDLMQSMELEAYRFSISWPRIQPSGSGKVNTAGLGFYSRLVDGLLARGIKPIATLYHWDLPQDLQDKGGWTNRDTAYRFAEYASIVGEALGDRVYAWTTLNEPWCTAYLGHGSGEHAPGVTNPLAALTAVHHLNLAHGLAVTELRRAIRGDALVSITLNFTALRGGGAGEEEAMRRIDAVANRAFTGPLLHGAYPQDLLEDTARITDWAFVRPGDLDLIHQNIDFLGVNYYTTATVRMAAESAVKRNPDGSEVLIGSKYPGSERVEFVVEPGPFTDMGWNIAPDAFEELLVDLHEQFPTLPLMITENGAAFPDEVVDGRVQDKRRVDYLHRHFVAAHRAIARGVDLRGYLVWSLMDNFEWAFGYSKRFGIVHVDYESLERTVKDSGHFVTELIRTRRIPGSGR